MLKPISKPKVGAVTGRFAIVASRYNSHYVDALLRAAKKELRGAGVKDLEIVRVPGAYEIPVVAARLATVRRPALAAIICLGVILRGQTTHAQHVAEAVSLALAQLQVERELPVIHGVLLFENTEQARVRCLGKEHNRGTEAARTALEMSRVMASIQPKAE